MRAILLPLIVVSAALAASAQCAAEPGSSCYGPAEPVRFVRAAYPRELDAGAQALVERLQDLAEKAAAGTTGGEVRFTASVPYNTVPAGATKGLVLRASFFAYDGRGGPRPTGTYVASVDIFVNRLPFLTDGTASDGNARLLLYDAPGRRQIFQTDARLGGEVNGPTPILGAGGGEFAELYYLTRRGNLPVRALSTGEFAAAYLDYFVRKYGVEPARLTIFREVMPETMKKVEGGCATALQPYLSGARAALPARVARISTGCEPSEMFAPDAGVAYVFDENFLSGSLPPSAPQFFVFAVAKGKPGDAGDAFRRKFRESFDFAALGGLLK